MDPKAALDSAESAIKAGDLEEAEEFLANYREWRRKGGFEPDGGDLRCGHLSMRMAARASELLNEGPSNVEDGSDEEEGWEHYSEQDFYNDAFGEDDD